MTTSTRKSGSRVVTNEELEAYKRQVRAEAIRVAAQQGWCDTGLNETLTTLDLPPKREYTVPVALTVTYIYPTVINDADSYEDAVEKVRTRVAESDAQQYVENVLGSQYKAVSVGVAEIPDPDNAVMGDADPTQRELAEADGNTCGEYSPRGRYCMRAYNHGGTQHLRVHNSRVTEVWPVAPTS